MKELNAYINEGLLTSKGSVKLNDQEGFKELLVDWLLEVRSHWDKDLTREGQLRQYDRCVDHVSNDFKRVELDGLYMTNALICKKFPLKITEIYTQTGSFILDFTKEDGFTEWWNSQCKNVVSHDNVMIYNLPKDEVHISISADGPRISGHMGKELRFPAGSRLYLNKVDYTASHQTSSVSRWGEDKYTSSVYIYLKKASDIQNIFIDKNTDKTWGGNRGSLNIVLPASYRANDSEKIEKELTPAVRNHIDKNLAPYFLDKDNNVQITFNKYSVFGSPAAPIYKY